MVTNRGGAEKYFRLEKKMIVVQNNYLVGKIVKGVIHMSH